VVAAIFSAALDTLLYLAGRQPDHRLRPVPVRVHARTSRRG
jgi:hypothetical protein